MRAVVWARNGVKGGAILWLVFCLLGLSAWASAAQAAGHEVTGVWWSPRKDAKIELYLDSSGVLAGRLIAMPNKTALDFDTKNPDASLRRRPLLGMVIFSGFRMKERNQWVDGKAYDPQSGGTFSAHLWLEDGDHVTMRGYLGLPLFGRNETFTRVGGNEPYSHQPGEPELLHLDPAKR